MMNIVSNCCEDYNPIFLNEISNIMRGFGDVEAKYQHRDSIILVEKIVRTQMQSFFQEAINLSVIFQGKPKPRQKDFEFLLRKNPAKILRLQTHLRDLHYFKKHVRTVLGERYQSLKDESLYDLSEDDSEMEVIEIYDEEKTRRIIRADRISQILSAGAQYQEYSEARKASFLCRNTTVLKSKMRDWLRIPTDVQLSSKVLTILAFLSHEIVATLVDFCLISRLNSGNRKTSKEAKIKNETYFCPEVTQGRADDGMKPITVQEINEVIRRHSLLISKRFGHNRNNFIHQKLSLLAL